MGDLQYFLSSLFEKYLSLSKQPSANKYIQLMAVGGERISINLIDGYIDSIRAFNDSAITIVSAEKKAKSWLVAKSVESGFQAFAQWQQIAKRIAGNAVAQPDPRPAPVDLPQPEEIPPLRHYDPDAALLLPAIIFHRLFQSLGKVVEQQYRIQANCNYLNGRYSYRMTPLCYAFVDPAVFSFQPQTTLSESICICHKNNPQIRRFAYHTSSRLDDLLSLDDLIEDISHTPHDRLIAFNPPDFDQIVLMPGAVAQLMHTLLKPFESDPDSATPPDHSYKWLSESLDLICDPADPLFGRANSVDLNGVPTRTIQLIHNGFPDSIPTSQPIAKKLKIQDNGHASSSLGHAEPFCPILRAANENTYTTAATPKQLTENHRNFVLCIENLKICSLDPKTKIVCFPDGGVLYQNGKCISHVAPPDTAFLLLPLIQSASAASAPIRIGALAACALALDANAFIKVS